MTSLAYGYSRLLFTLFFVLGTLSDVSSFIPIPDAFPTFLHFIYGKIPPLRKGIDSRFGVGFRMGEHADFQMLLELGPQKRTQAIGNTENAQSKRNIDLHSQRKSKSQKYENNTETDSLSLQDSNKQVEEKNSLGREWILRWRNGLAMQSKKSISPGELTAVNITTQDVQIQHKS